jgi:hypothetical protein
MVGIVGSPRAIGVMTVFGVRRIVASFLLGASQAGLQSLNLAEPASLTGIGEPFMKVANDLDEPVLPQPFSQLLRHRPPDSLARLG